MQINLNPLALLAQALTADEARQRSLVGRGLAWQVREREVISGLADVEFSVFSQFGDDGIIQWLIHRLSGLRESCIQAGARTMTS
ncbi:hypothetical protein [Mycobacterium intracellulare]|uniref:hypothetical protein n=1 Tax=Mycobacterium intracellulare TaxID=1767 RepID=UPI001E34EE95|nr:hypothetical protein [Mycobacterium intracellulare]